MIEKEKICRLMSEKLLASDDYLVDVQVKPGNLVVVEVDNDRGVSIETCAELNRYIRENILAEEDYELEVGSPGLSAPFKILRQYAKYTGREVECLLKTGEKLQGILMSADESGIRLAVETQVKPEGGAKRKQTITEEKAYGYEEIKHTKYVISFK